MVNRPLGAVIDIEGVIGVPGWWQFEDEHEQAATYENFRRQVEQIKQTAARRIRVNIRSIGGNINDALLIYEALCGLEAEEITTSCQGYVASAATVIAQAATQGRRLISASALYLVHNSTTSVEGNSQEVEHTARLLGKTDERIAEIYAARSGRPIEEFRELMARDGGRGEWLSPAEAVAHGLADRIDERSPLAAMGRRVRDFFRRRGEGSERVEAEAEVSGVALMGRVQELQDRLEQLESEAARLQARPSATLPKEDPGILAPSGLEGLSTSGNRAAYDGDARALRTSY